MRKQIFITLFVLGIAIQLLAQQENNQVPALLPKSQKVVWNLDEEFELFDPITDSISDTIEGIGNIFGYDW